MGVEFQGMKRPPPKTVRITIAPWLRTMFAVASVVSLDRKLTVLSPANAVYKYQDRMYIKLGYFFEETCVR